MFMCIFQFQWRTTSKNHKVICLHQTIQAYSKAVASYVTVSRSALANCSAAFTSRGPRGALSRKTLSKETLSTLTQTLMNKNIAMMIGWCLSSEDLVGQEKSAVDNSPAEKWQRHRLALPRRSESMCSSLLCKSEKVLWVTCLTCDHSCVHVGLSERHSTLSRMELNMCLMENFVIETLINVSPPVHVFLFPCVNIHLIGCLDSLPWLATPSISA